MFLMPARAVTQNYKMTLKNQRFKGSFLFLRGGSHYFNLTGSKILARVGQISVAFPSMNYINEKYICTMTTKKNLSVGSQQRTLESLLKDIRRNTKRIFTSEQKVLIVMEGIRGEQSIAELCRKYGISDSTYYKWNKEFIEAGKARLDGDIVREATSDEVKELRQENIRLKGALADLVVRYDVVKKA